MARKRVVAVTAVLLILALAGCEAGGMQWGQAPSGDPAAAAGGLPNRAVVAAPASRAASSSADFSARAWASSWTSGVSSSSRRR